MLMGKNEGKKSRGYSQMLAYSTAGAKYQETNKVARKREE